MTLVLPDREPNEHEIALIKATTALRLTELEKAKKDLAMVTIIADESADKVKLDRAANQRNRTFDYVAPVTEDTVEGALDIISRWHRISHDPITVRFTSPGGSPISGLVLLDALTAMKAEGTPITTVALGMAASMAAVLLQAGSPGQRVIGPTARIMIHQGSMEIGGKVRDVEEQKILADAILAGLVEILAERSTLTKAEIKRKIANGKDWWLNSDDAIKFGFADRKGYN